MPTVGSCTTSSASSPSSRRAWIEIGGTHEHSSGLRWSPSSRRAWIEITERGCYHMTVTVALLAEGVDRNCFCNNCIFCVRRSPSSRRAWIEISAAGVAAVLPASPSSRRAWIEIKKATGRTSGHSTVALLAEGVDRNGLCAALPVHERAVALLAEGVDRNPSRRTAQASSMRPSPSSRRAWIEIASRTSSNLPTFCRPPRGGRG